MPKTSTVYVCQSCAYNSPKWLGQCPNCGAWNSFEETLKVSKKGFVGAGTSTAVSTQPILLSSVRESDALLRRLESGISEFDRVLGGGIVLGSVILLGGEPGIGKSTILTQIILNILINHANNIRIAYVCGEESPEQIALRIGRLSSIHQSKTNSWKEQLLFYPSTDTDSVIASIEQEKPSIVVVDSIQSMQTSDLTGAAGSVGQLKESTLRFTRMAKSLGIPVFLVGHVTKEGVIAGPKVLEHIVDTVIELSGERTGHFRLLRSIKNRFGATDEVGVFQVVEEGLEEVKDPSRVFLSDAREKVPGSAIVPVMEGTRVIMMEIQALVVDSQLPAPRRVGRGISLPRIQLIAAVLQKHAGISLGTSDVFVNVAGGFIVNEPAADLAIAMAIASSAQNVPLSSEIAYAGEIGLLGEIRHVSMEKKRVKDAKRQGFLNVVTAEEEKYLRRLITNAVRKNRSAS